MEGSGQRAAGVDTVGRESELARLQDFLLEETPRRALVIAGPPGIGKTTLWEAGVVAARAGGLTVLSAQASEAEAHLPFTTLSDLVGGLDLAAFPDLPPPQRHALEVALLRADPGERPPAPRATAHAVLNLLGRLEAEAPVVVAIDDVQWADSASVEAVAFALRRLRGRVRFLAARRPGHPTMVEAAIGPHLTEEIAVQGLTLGATRHLLATRLGLTLPRRALRQLHDTTLGYPYFALELGREFQAHGPPAIGDELHLPDSLDALLEASVARRPDAARALLAVALYGSAPPSILVSVVGEETLDAAVDAGLLIRDGASLRQAHPLLAAAAIKHASAGERRSLHRALARISQDPVRRARHLAAAATEPDRQLAAVVETGVTAASGRGATLEAIELAEQALRLTPPDDPARDERILSLGEDLVRADELPRLRQLLANEFDSLAPGPARARGHLLLAAAALSQEDYERQLDAAVGASDGAPMVRALALATQARDAVLSFLERLDEGEARAMDAIALAAQGEGRAQAVYALSWVRILRGQPIDDLRPSSSDEASADATFAHARLEGIRFVFRGCLDEARTILEGGLQRAADLGQGWAHGAYVLQLAELALRAGDLRAADRWVGEHEGTEESVSIGLRSNAARLRAVAAAVKGDAVTADAWAATALRLVSGQRWDILEADRARGLGSLAAGRPGQAVPPLLRVWRHTVAEGIDDPGAFPVAPDLVEAALAVGDTDLASEVLERITRQSQEQDHPWGLASVHRCRGLTALARDPGDIAAHRMMTAAADAYDALGCRFDAARTLLALGRRARRARKWAAGREALARAATTFDELGCDGWSVIGRGLLQGLGGRRPTAPTTLTPSEERAVQLASRGLSNKEIAAALYVSEHTVEVHLAHAYPKLGVTSRFQLSAALPNVEQESSAPKP